MFGSSSYLQFICPVTLGSRGCCLLQVSEAAMFVTDETPPQHRATTGRTSSLHWQEVGRFRLQETPGDTCHMTTHPTGRVETAQLLQQLDRPLAEKTPGRLLLLLLPCRLQWQLLFGPHAAEGDGDVQRRLQSRLKVHPVLLLQPTGRQRQPVPWRHLQHVGNNTPVELKA